MSLPMNSPVFDAPALRMLAYACGIAGQFAGSRDGPSVFREALSTLPALARDISWDSWIEDSRPFSQIGPRRPYGPSPAWPRASRPMLAPQPCAEAFQC